MTAIFCVSAPFKGAINALPAESVRSTQLGHSETSSLSEVLPSSGNKFLIRTRLLIYVAMALHQKYHQNMKNV